MKKYLAFILAMVFVLSLVSCTPNDHKKFSCQEMTITLPDRFIEDTLEGYTIGFKSPEAAILALKESFEDYPVLRDYTLTKYAELVASNNTNLQMTQPENIDGIITTQHSFLNTDEQVNYVYLSAMFRSGEGFWLIQFACPENSFEEMKPYFIQWAKSVSFN